VQEKLPVQVEELITLGETFYKRNWIAGTAGNFSTVVRRRPFEWTITRTGVHRGSLTGSDFIFLNKCRTPHEAAQLPVAESPIHWVIMSNTGAGAVLQTHSVWSTILSDAYAQSGGFEIEGFEVLKSLYKAPTANPVEWVAILENSEDYLGLAHNIARLLNRRPDIHAILLRKHGLYSWGSTVQEAARHIETFELLFEVMVRQFHIFSQIEFSRASGPAS
jgi:methylthioribulose-1-phosphate dehydratase